MLISYKWLQRYFDAPLPSVDSVADALLFGAFEIDGIEKKGEDTILDVKITPNRAHDCLSHRGVAREVATLTEAEMSFDPLRQELPVFEVGDGSISLSVEDAKLSPLYAAVSVDGVKVGPSPAWLKELIENIGQRSINNIVDATNFVMFDLGTPLHVFDADKLKDAHGRIAIAVRSAKEGEKAVILGGREVELKKEETVIVDGNNDVIALAGVKGGIKAELTDATTSIVIEAAKFDPVRTRKTAQRLDLRTDASKRFENEIADELPLYGMQAIVKLILEVAGGRVVSGAVSKNEAPAWIYKVGTNARAVNALLGSQLSDAEIEALLGKLTFPFRFIDPAAEALTLARTLLGARYKNDSAMRIDAPHVFSCSSLTNYLYVHSGIAMPSISIDQYVWGEEVEKGTEVPGDLVFINSGEGRIRYESVAFNKGTKVPEGIDHVGIYIGEGKFLHASQTKNEVVIDSLENIGKSKVVGFRRVAQPGQKQFVIDVPFERLDVRIEADLIEEIGRVYGYGRIGTDDFVTSVEMVQLPVYYWSEKIRSALQGVGFTEVSTYTLTSEGNVSLKNSIAPERSKLRSSLAASVAPSLSFNERNAPLLGLSQIKIFEIGTVFPSLEHERMHVAFGVRASHGKNKTALETSALQNAKSAVESALGITPRYREKDGIVEFCLTETLEKLPMQNEPYPPFAQVDIRAVYTPFSVYPFALRDIALWVPENVSAQELASLIKESAGELLVRIDLFDEFKKDGKTSYAFHLVFQAPDRTLSDADIDPTMAAITSALETKGYEIR